MSAISVMKWETTENTRRTFVMGKVGFVGKKIYNTLYTHQRLCTQQLNWNTFQPLMPLVSMKSFGKSKSQFQRITRILIQTYSNHITHFIVCDRFVAEMQTVHLWKLGDIRNIEIAAIRSSGAA